MHLISVSPDCFMLFFSFSSSFSPPAVCVSGCVQDGSSIWWLVHHFLPAASSPLLHSYTSVSSFCCCCPNFVLPQRVISMSVPEHHHDCVHPRCNNHLRYLLLVVVSFVGKRNRKHFHFSFRYDHMHIRCVIAFLHLLILILHSSHSRSSPFHTLD